MLEKMAAGYESALKNSRNAETAPKQVRRVLQRAYKRRWHHLAEERIKDVTPAIPLGKCFWPLSRAENREKREYSNPGRADLGHLPKE